MLIGRGFRGPSIGGGSIDFVYANQQWLGTDTSISAIGTGDVTFEAWIKPDSYTESFIALSCIEQWQSGGFAVYLRGGGARDGQITVYGAGGTNHSFSSANFTLGTWQHLAVCRYGTALACFQDGTLVGTDGVGWGGSINAGRLCLANDNYDNPDYFFDGKIAFARWSNTRRYTSAFTPDTAYGVDDDTVGLIGSDGSTIEEYAASRLINLNGNSSTTPTASAESPAT